MGQGFTPEVNVDKLLRLYGDGERDFENINLKQVNLIGVNLSELLTIFTA